MKRERLFLSDEQIEQLGFKQKGEGDDPRDFWHEIELKNADHTDEPIMTLEYDAYCCFSLNHEFLDESIPINFQAIEEVEIFIKVFNREYNHAFSGLLDLCKEEKCTCEMPAKIKGENKCWRCKRPID